ncbi:DUF4142 domain-containing protein [Myxococcus sp. CA051A]|uniref:DUF4142 domain-containing protein n=1 Tax=unclassified Myxococcus TaxID=2648731 RepID=UPI00157B4AA8|nr:MULTISPECIES: DUF4142 domain-containing protein [unclassified Myxococcus]NTX50826.1 DUF4142 domain-containing protein [Myxococcus sp. CA039A]NTX63247.1 DUF4142 domain-containing protein [Myxococcus sp. CA051A]
MMRWHGWMLVGSLVLGGTAGAQDNQDAKASDTPTTQNNGTGDSQGMIRMGEADAIDHGEDIQKDPSAWPGTGGSGQPDAQAAKWMREGLLPIPTEEKAFLEELHHANQMEVQMGKLAQKNGSSKGVKDFGARMEREHGQADENLLAFAKTKKLQLGEPKADSSLAKAMQGAEHATMEKLQALQGPAFDRAFLAAMVGDHDVVIAKVMAGQQQFVDNTALKTMLDNLLPQLQQHRQSAYRLLGQETPRQARQAPRGGR